MINVLVVGAGLIGKRHVEAVAKHPLTRLAGVVETDPRLRAALEVPVFADLDAVDVAVDAAICAVPTQLHGKIGADCAGRGWAVLMEKPVAETLAEADALIEACREVPLLVGHHRRHHPFVQKTKELLADGTLGDLVAVNGIWSVRKPDAYFKGNWRAGAAGSPVSINLVHDLDLLRFMVGDVVDVTGILSQHIRGRGVEDSGAVSLRFEGGAVGSFIFSDTGASPWGFEAASAENPNIASSSQDCYRFIGTKGSLSFPSLTLWSGSPDWSKPQVSEKIEVERLNPLDAQLNHLCDVVEKGASPLIDGEDARKTLALVEQVMALGGDHGSINASTS